MFLLTIILVIASANADLCLTESKRSQMRTNLGDIEQLLQGNSFFQYLVPIILGFWYFYPSQAYDVGITPIMCL